MPVLGSRWQALRVSQEPLILMAQSAVAVAHTGGTTETTLATITIPGGTIGPNGRVEIEAVFSHTNSANIKTLKIRFGGSTIAQVNATTTGNNRIHYKVANRNSQSSQVYFSATSTSGSGAPSTLANSTAVDFSITITGQLALGTETVTLESYIVKIFPGD